MTAAGESGRSAGGGPKLGAALYAGWVALVITGIVGGLGLAFQQPWLFPSLGPTIYIHTVTPNQDAARPWNTFVGHAIGAAAAFLSLAIFGALHAAPAMTAGHISMARIAASGLAVALTIGGQIPVRASHAPATATTLLITLGGLPADLATVGVLVVGISLATFLCDWGRRAALREFRFLRKEIPTKPPAYRPYAPLSTLKCVADDIWVVDGPEIAMQYVGIDLPFPTRMTIVRLPTGELWLHSPIACDDALVSVVRELGLVAFLVAPSTLHYWYLPDWQAIFPDARTFAPASLMPKAHRQFRIDESLGDVPPEAWREVMGQCLVTGGLMTEVDFFHRPSRSLILTDLIENFEPSRVRKLWLRWAMNLFGAADPHGKAPYDMQLSFIGHRRALRRAVKRMITWAPERIIIAHGRWYDRDGVAELQRAFRWVL